MKDAYLKDLKEALNKFNISNSEVILEKYSRWFDFALKANLKPEKIIEMLGNPELIASDYIGNDLIIDYKDGFNLVIKTACDNIDILYSLDDKINVLIKNIDVDSYDVFKNDNTLKMEIKKDFINKQKKPGSIRIEIPINKLINNIYLSTHTGDITMLSLNCNRVIVNNVEGDIIFDKIRANKSKIVMDFGSVHGGILQSSLSVIRTVSSNVQIDYLASDIGKIETITGNVVIDKSRGMILTKSMSGDIWLNGHPAETTTKHFINDLFKVEDKE